MRPVVIKALAFKIRLHVNERYGDISPTMSPDPSERLPLTFVEVAFAANELTATGWTLLHVAARYVEFTLWNPTVMARHSVKTGGKSGLTDA